MRRFFIHRNYYKIRDGKRKKIFLHFLYSRMVRYFILWFKFWIGKTPANPKIVLFVRTVLNLLWRKYLIIQKVNLLEPSWIFWFETPWSKLYSWPWPTASINFCLFGFLQKIVFLTFTRKSYPLIYCYCCPQKTSDKKIQKKKNQWNFFLFEPNFFSIHL